MSVTRKVDSSGKVCFAGYNWTVGKRFIRQVQVAIVIPPQDRHPTIGESLEEAPDAMRAVARPFTPSKRKQRPVTAVDRAFVTALNAL